MEPKQIQYNDKIYNRNVVLLREKIRDFEEHVLNGTLQVASIHDFHRVYEEANAIHTEFEALYEGSPNQVYTSELNSYFAYEREFLNDFISFLEVFNRYHEVVEAKMISNAVIQQEWEDVVSIIRFNKIEKQLKELESLLFDENEEHEVISKFIANLNKDIEPFEDLSQEKWQNMVLIKAFQKLDDKLARIDAAKNGSEYFRLKDLYATLEKKMYESVFPRMKIKISNTNFWNKERYDSDKKLLGEVCKKITEKNHQVVVHSLSHILDAWEDPAYYTEQVKEILNQPVENQIDYKGMRTKEYQAERKKDILIDMDFYEQLTPSSKIMYLRFLLQNIINKKEEKEFKGFKLVKSRIDGKVWKYPRCYQPRFEKYRAMLLQLENAYEQDKVKEAEEEPVTAQDPVKKVEIDEVVTERYAELVVNLEEIKRAMFFLEEEAKSYLDKEKIQSFPMEDREAFVLESSYHRYQELYTKRKAIEDAIKEISMRNGYVFDDSDDKYYENIRFIKENEKDPERAKDQKVFWQKKLREAHQGKKNAKVANIKAALKIMEIPEKFQKEYTQIATDPQKFLKSKKYSDDTKRKGFGNLFSIFSNFTSKKSTNKELSKIVEDSNATILKSLAMLPVNETKVYKVFATKKVKDIGKMNERRIRMQENVRKVSGYAAMFCSLIIVELNVLNTIAPLVPRAKSSVSIEKTAEFEDASRDELKGGVKVDDILTAGIQSELWVDKLILFNKQNADWKMTTQKHFIDSQMVTSSYDSSAIGGTLSKEEAPTIEESMNPDEICLHGLVSIKPDALVYTVHGDSLRDVSPQAFIGDTSVLYEITGIQYENGVWISAEGNQSDAEAMFRAYNAQGVSIAEVRLVNPTTGEYAGHFTLDNLEQMNVRGRG